MTPKIDLVYFNAGGGHRAAALALEAAIRTQGWPWQVRRVNLAEVLDPNERFRSVTGIAPEDLYNLRLARGWTLGLRQELRMLQAAIRAAHGPLVRRLSRHWAESEPDLVVSLIPNFNRALAESLALACPGVPFVTVLTDLADLPPHFWIEPGLQQRIVCGTDEAVAQARRAGYGRGAVWRVSGMLLRPAFHEPPAAGKAQRRAAIGLQPARPTALVMYGAYGSAEMLEIAAALPEMQLILMCGRNARLARRLRALPGPGGRHAVVEFTEDVPAYMAAADFFIGKPGPGCLSEALQLGLPVITFGNAWTMPQERFNVRWVCEQGYGLAVRSVRELPAAVNALLADLPAYAARVPVLRNRAAFEVPQILARLLRQSGPTVRELHVLRAPARRAFDPPVPQEALQ
ncbi:MAG: galactosyldiacylglycerol synthase [Burkholderiales bacterium]|nr:galactosyldiacylglycerol synthase [Burkholderiales bacterium]